MEDHEYKVIKSHATLFQNSSKFTSNVSKNTSKSTSETNQIRFRVGATGGATPRQGGAPRAWEELVGRSTCCHCQGTGYITRGLWRDHHEGSMETRGDLWETRRETNGYPFTTFDLSQTFLQVYCQV